MPGTNEGSPDEIERILSGDGNDGATDDFNSVDNEAGDSSQTQGTQTQSRQGTQPQAGQSQKPSVNWESRYKQLQPQYTKASQRAKEMESLLRDPQFQALAQKDPKVFAALSKLGYAQAKEIVEEADEDSKSGEPDWENDPVAAVKLMRADLALDREERALEESLGRKLSNEERKWLNHRIAASEGTLNIEDAWLLSPMYQKLLKEQESKRIEDAINRRVPPHLRPKPVSVTSSGQKIDLKKNVTDMKDDNEKAAKIQELLNSNQ